jgi:hypothetical protein
MKKLITGLVLGALCCMLFSTPAFPTKYDPSRPPPTPYANVGTGSSSSDEIGWGEPMTSSSPGGKDRINSSPILLYIDVPYNPYIGLFLHSIWRFIVPSTQIENLIHETTSGDRVNQNGQETSR